MPPKGIRSQIAKQKNTTDEMTLNTPVHKENNSFDDNSAQQSVQKSTKSRKRTQKPGGISTPPANEPKRQKPEAVQKIELIITPTSTEDDNLDFGEEGLYPVKDGELLKKRYKVDKMLGFGGYATVHMATDTKTKTNVALKIVRCGESYNEGADREISFMQKVKGASSAASNSNSPFGSTNIVSLLDSFRIKGAYGMHVVMVTEVLGPDLFSILVKSNQKVLSLNRIQKFSKDILNGLHFLHSKCKVMHLDLKPENILVTMDPENMDLNDSECSASVKICDFGMSCLTTKNATETVQTCHYRAPEVFLKARVTPAADIWSFGCTLYEMTTRRLLFNCNDTDNCRRKFHIDCILNTLGPIRKNLFKNAKENEWILHTVFREQNVLFGIPGSTDPICVEELKKKRPMEEHQAQACSEFLKELMNIDPKKRLTVEQALKHAFLMERC